MSWFINQTVNAVLQLVIALVVYITNKLVLPLGFSPEVVTTYFSQITLFTEAFKILSIFILILIVLFQLTKNIFGLFSYGEKDNSIILVLRAGIAVALIFWSMSLMSYMFTAFSQPFYILNDNEDIYKAFDVVNDENGIFKNTISESFNNFISSAENLSESEYDTAVDRITDWMFPGKSIIKGLVELICIAVIGYKFILFLLEILERYLLLMLQAFTSPLIWSTFPSQSTIGIFKKWFEIFISNFVLMYLNMWMLGLIVKAMETIFDPELDSGVLGSFRPNFILGVSMIYAMIRIAQVMDNYIAKLLTTAVTGTGLGQEIFMTARTLQESAKSFLKPSATIAHSVFDSINSAERFSPDKKIGLEGPRSRMTFEDSDRNNDHSKAISLFNENRPKHSSIMSDKDMRKENLLSERLSYEDYDSILGLSEFDSDNSTELSQKSIVEEEMTSTIDDNSVFKQENESTLNAIDQPETLLGEMIEDKEKTKGNEMPLREFLEINNISKDDFYRAAEGILEEKDIDRYSIEESGGAYTLLDNEIGPNDMTKLYSFTNEEVEQLRAEEIDLDDRDQEIITPTPYEGNTTYEETIDFESSERGEGLINNESYRTEGGEELKAPLAYDSVFDDLEKEQKLKDRKDFLQDQDQIKPSLSSDISELKDHYQKGEWSQARSLLETFHNSPNIDLIRPERIQKMKEKDRSAKGLERGVSLEKFLERDHDFYRTAKKL